MLNTGRETRPTRTMQRWIMASLLVLCALFTAESQAQDLSKERTEKPEVERKRSPAPATMVPAADKATPEELKEKEEYLRSEEGQREVARGRGSAAAEKAPAPNVEEEDEQTKKLRRLKQEQEEEEKKRTPVPVDTAPPAENPEQ